MIKHGYKSNIILLMLLSILLMMCNQLQSKHQLILPQSFIVAIPANIYLHSTIAPFTENLLHDLHPALSAPTGLKMLKVSMVATHLVGTVSHPTINGGIINQMAGVIVDDEPLLSTIPSISTISINPHSKVSHAVSFQDAWTNNAKLHQVLQQAIENGKLAYVLKASHEQHLPASVALIPMIESSYHTNVTSAKGAAGAWQLMPSVAHDYGIKLQQRYQFKASTQVALELLQDLHQHFHNWQLTFAAYNAGSERVTQALRQHPFARTLAQLHLPAATQNYVAQLQQLDAALSREAT